MAHPALYFILTVNKKWKIIKTLHVKMWEFLCILMEQNGYDERNLGLDLDSK